jgi:nitronate monooxygenase
MRGLTGKPFAINLWVSTSDRPALHVPAKVMEEKIRELARYYAELGIEPPSGIEAKPQNFETQVRAAMDAGAPVLSFIYGVPPQEILAECRKRLFRTISTATTPEEVVVLEEGGIELIVASGFEGGGHRGSFLRSPADSLIGGFSLIPQVADAVAVPVIAAGGIADGRGLQAAFALGAEGVQIGTAFLTCEGSGASTLQRKALLSTPVKRTNLTDAFTGRLARAVENRLMHELSDVRSARLPFPLQHSLIQTVAGPASTQGREELIPLWAGQSLALCCHTHANGLMAELIAAGEDCSRRKTASLGKNL